MEKIRVINNSFDEFKKGYQIYKDSFPHFEQRRIQEQIAVLVEKKYHFEVVKKSGEVVGILLYWDTEDFIFIEHFAVHEKERGKNIGSEILLELIENSSKPIMLEIDPPIDSVSINRQHFYERLGFTLSNFEYFHPSYSKSGTEHLLKIMAVPNITESEFKSFLKFLKKNHLSILKNNIEIKQSHVNL